MKKYIVAGIGAVMLLASTAGMNSVYAVDGNQQHSGGKFEAVSKYKDQIHQVNSLRSERLGLKKQIVDKKDQLVDLILAAKKSKNKTELKLAKGVKQQLKALNVETKSLFTQAHNERKELKEALKNKTGVEGEQFNRLLATNKQINKKLTEMVKELDRMIDILK